MDTFANNGIVRKPLISVHGTLDALIPLKGHARPYKAMVEARGYGQIIASMRFKMGITWTALRVVRPDNNSQTWN